MKTPTAIKFLVKFIIVAQFAELTKYSKNLIINLHHSIFQLDVNSFESIKLSKYFLEYHSSTDTDMLHSTLDKIFNIKNINSMNEMCPSVYSMDFNFLITCSYGVYNNARSLVFLCY